MNKLEQNIDEFQSQANDYREYMMEYANGYISGLFKEGIIKDVTAEELQKMFRNPDEYQEEIERLANYFYITNSEIHQLFEMIEVLPQLNYRIETFSKPKNSDIQLNKLTKHLHKVKHKRLTRDLLKQSTSSGNVVGLWLGNKSKPYPFVFDENKYVFPVGRNNNGEWVCVLDMTWFDDMNDAQQELYFNTLSDVVTRKDYDSYRDDLTNKRYFILPHNRTFSLRTGILKHNQAQGTSWITSGLLDVLHKKKLKDVEQSIANKIINAVAVLTIGSDKNDGKYSNSMLNKTQKLNIHNGVKKALEKKQEGGVTVVTIPDYASIVFPDIDTDGLDGNKFGTINSDIRSAYGMSGAMLNGEGVNYASAKLNLDIFYKRLAVLLEDIETEVYQKLFNLMLPSNQEDNFYIEYDKEPPLTKKEKLDYLKGLNDKGWASKPFIEEIGYNFNTFYEQTVYENEELKIFEMLKPPPTSHTQNSDNLADNNGRPKTADSDVENENTIRGRESSN